MNDENIPWRCLPFLKYPLPWWPGLIILSFSGPWWLHSLHLDAPHGQGLSLFFLFCTPGNLTPTHAYNQCLYRVISQTTSLDQTSPLRYSASILRISKAAPERWPLDLPFWDLSCSAFPSLGERQHQSLSRTSQEHFKSLLTLGSPFLDLTVITPDTKPLTYYGPEDNSWTFNLPHLI